jgi:hypothetical protein
MSFESVVIEQGYENRDKRTFIVRSRYEVTNKEDIR